MAAHPECQALRDKVTGEMGGHGLQREQDVAVPGTSRHESGTAFDLTPHGLTKAQMAPIYAGCGVKNTKVKKEPWHTQ
jgi:LAS superfamily LD-carboxypeptidase LdcB